MKKRIVSIILTLCMMLTAQPVSAQESSTTLTAGDGSELQTDVLNRASGDRAVDMEIPTSLAVPAAVQTQAPSDDAGLQTDIPNVAAQTQTVNNEAGLKSAIANGVPGGTITIGGDFSVASTILISKNVTLDLAGHILTYTGGQGTLCLQFTAGGAIADSVGGGTITGSGAGIALIHNAGGTLEIAGGTLTVDGNQQSRVVHNDGTLRVTGGVLNSVSGYGVLNYGAVVVTGGQIVTDTGNGVLNYAAGSTLTVSGGVVKTTSLTAEQAYAACNNIAGASINVNGGTISAGRGSAVGNFNGGTIVINGGDVSADNGLALFNHGDSVAAIHSGTVRAVSGYGVLNYGNLLIDGGIVSSESSVALTSFAKGGMDIRLSGGTITAKGAASVYNNGSGEIQLLGSTVSTTAQSYPAVVNNSTGAVSVTDGTITAAGSNPTFYNVSSGTIAIKGGTHSGVYNASATGLVKIDGGSLKLIQGTTAKNSSGVALQPYIIKLTNNGAPIANTPVSGSELTFTPADKAAGYGFTGVRTDGDGRLYLWLPEGIKSGLYKSQTVDITGAVSSGTESLLPNFNVSVTVYLNDRIWPDCPLEHEPMLVPEGSTIGRSVMPKSKSGGVFTYSGLDKDTLYEVWGRTHNGFGFSGVKVSKTSPSVEVHYYTLTVNNAGGISFIYPRSGTNILKGTNVVLGAFTQSGLTFEKWTDGEGNTVSTVSEFSIGKLDGPRTYTAKAKVAPFDAGVTVRKDGTAWSAFDGEVVLSPSADNANTILSGTALNGVYTFPGLSQTYYVWAKLSGGQLVYTGQKVTFGATAAAVDYYTVILNKGSHINQVTGAGTYLKGSPVSISAEVSPESGGLNYIFSRWSEGNSLLSTTNPYAIPAINRSYDLTAEGRVGAFAATVTLNKDGARWTSSPRSIHLTQQGSDAPITGVASNGVYTFTGLDSSKIYEIWDDETVRKTGVTLDASTHDRTLNYFTVTASKGSWVTSVSGGGVYLGGSTVTVTAKPEAYYTVTWQAMGTVGTADGVAYTVSNLSAATTLNATGDLVNFTGTVTLKKDDALWSGQTVSLSTAPAIPGNIAPTQSLNGSYTFNPLDPHNTYSIFVNGKATGKTLSHTAINATLDYYTVEVDLENVTSEAKVGTVGDSGPYPKGTAVDLTAALTNPNHDFVGWFSGSTLLTTEKELAVFGIVAKQTLSAKANSTFAVTVTVSGKADISTIKFSDSSAALTNALSGTAVGSTLTFENLNRGTTYYIFDGSAYTGKSVSKTVTAAALQFYTITVAPGPGISTATANTAATATVLEGTTVTLNAVEANGYGFSRWVDAGGNTVAQTNPATVIAGKNMILTAVSTAIYTGGDIDINTGSVVISDSATAGKLKIVQGATTWESIDPSQNITVKGGGTQTSNNITISAKLAGAAPGSAVRLTLKDVNIKWGGPGLEIKSDAGDIELTISGNNSLETSKGDSGAILKTGSQKLTIRSIDGTTAHTLKAFGYAALSSGIGVSNTNVKNIIIDSGILYVSGWGSGIGSWGSVAPLTEGIIINGGTIRGSGDNDSACIGSTQTQKGDLANVTINGGTARLWLNGKAPSGMKFNGGNLLLGIAQSVTPQNAAGDNVYLTTLTIPGDTAGGLDVSKTLVIKDKNNILYGMNDVVTFPGGKVYAYLPVGSATIVYNGKTYQISVESTSSVNLLPLNKFNVLPSKTVNGVTATATPPVFTGTGYSVTVTLSGTATKPGVINLGLLGSIGNVASQTHTVDSGVVSGVTKTFVFPVPPNDVTDLALAMTFTETSAYTVSYTASNATAGVVPVDTNSYYAGNTYTVAAAGTLLRTGYTFAGWKLGSVTHGANSTQTMGTSDAVYTATWSPNTYSVVFNGNGSTSGAMANQSFTYDANAAALSSNSFTRTGYTFAGWATSANGLKAYTQGEAVRNLTAAGNGTVSLYALWKANTYTVTFAGNGATAGTTENQTVAHSTPTPLNANGFVRTGYSFAGWKAGDGTPYANGASIAANGNVTLTAQWTGNPYSVSFNGNGSTAGSMHDTDLAYGTAGNLPPNGFSRAGYTFAGWNTAADGTGTPYVDQAQANGLTTVYNGTVQLYAQWTANTYAVQFNRNGGDSGTMAPQSFTYDAADTALSGNQFLRSGYVFAGWNSAVDGSGTAYGEKEPVRNLIADANGVVQLYAQWKAGSFTVNFNSGSGIGDMSPQTFQTGDTTALKTNAFTRSGYTFTGWNTETGGGGKGYTAHSTVNTLDLGGQDNITLYAQWTSNTYTVNFDANGATGPMVQQNFVYDQSTAALTQKAFDRTGYTFIGWAVSPTATYGEYADMQPVRNLTPMPNGVVTLFAIWKANSVPVVFDGNGATGGTMGDQSFAYNTEQPLIPNSYLREGHTFAGWNTQSSGRGVSYSDGQRVTDPTPDVTGKMTLYAQWQQQSRYGLSGLVTNDIAAPIPDAAVTLRQGSTVLGITKTDANGRYSFINLLPGIYNVVCADDGKTVTKAMTVVDSPVTVSFILSGTAKNSVLELAKEGSLSIPALVVDGLHAVADAQAQPGQITTVKLTVTAKAPNDQNTEQVAIRALTNGHTVGMYLDAQLTSNGASIGSNNNKVLEIMIPYDVSSKTDIKVLRYHDGTADILTKLNSRPASDFTDGTWFGDASAGRIFVYASKFSTYAVSYSVPTSGGGTSGGSGSGSGGGGGGSSGYPVTIDGNGMKHGTVTADRTSAPMGAEITITVQPDKGYQLQRLTITDAEGKAIRYTDKGNGTYAFAMPAGKVTVSAVFLSEPSPEVPKADFPFVDVPGSHWAYGDIAWAYQNGIITGTGDGTTFSPGLSTTRGMIATLLWRMERKPAAAGSCPFEDVSPASYYEQAIAWAAEKKIVEGYGNRRFGPEDTITREQMAAILYRYAGYKGYDVSKNESLHGFSDSSQTSSYAVKAMGWAVVNRFIGGKGSGILDPKAGATRAEVATILKRFNGGFQENRN